MRKQLLLSTGMICLLLAPAVSYGQAPAGRDEQKQMRPSESGKGAASSERGAERAPERAPAAEQRSQGREERGVGSRQSEERGKAGSNERPATASDDSKRGRGEDAKSSERAQDSRSSNRDAQTARDAKDNARDGKGNAEMKRDSDRSRADSDRAKDGTTAQREREGATTQRDSGRDQRDGARNAAEQGKETNRPSTATDTTRTPPANSAQGAPAGASQTQVNQQSNISVEKQTRISQTMTRERLAEPERNLNISIRVGERAPDRIRYHRLPDTIVTIEPEYRGYDYFTTDDEIVIVEPGTRRIVSQVPRDASRIRAAEGRGGGTSGISSTSGTATGAGAGGAMTAAEAQCRVMRRDTAGNITEVTPQTVGSTAQQPDTISVTVRLPGGASTAPIPLGAPDGQIVVSAQSGADCVVTLEPQAR
ncbi:MAG: DUF1236 domain-containing protein [Bradyrhizobium sp.]